MPQCLAGSARLRPGASLPSLSPSSPRLKTVPDSGGAQPNYPTGKMQPRPGFKFKLAETGMLDGGEPASTPQSMPWQEPDSDIDPAALRRGRRGQESGEVRLSPSGESAPRGWVGGRGCGCGPGVGGWVGEWVGRYECGGCEDGCVRGIDGKNRFATNRDKCWH